ncbi:hypothetical protein V7201_22140 [Bacillus sp. JJ1122]|uniref:hypothetical protein n=1 Tax=Bacillus sp. JJ1122 TaxID=3122951 RepID=UPI002FFF2CD2
MPRKSAATNENTEKQPGEEIPLEDGDEETKAKAEIQNLNRLLAAVLNYLSDDEVEVIDIEYLLQNTEGLQKWWDQYKEKNRKKIEEEIKKSLGNLSMEELESIREKIKGKDK